MAEWIPIEASTPRKVELVKIAAATGRSRHEVMGLVLEFWCWAAREIKDGHVAIAVSALPSIIVGSDQSFWSALADVGWLAPDADGSGFTVPRPEHWLSPSAKCRLLEECKGGGRGGDICSDTPVGPPGRTGSALLCSEPGVKRARAGKQNRTEQSRGRRAFKGGLPAEPNRTEQKKGSAFRDLTVEDLRDTAKLAEWLRWQDTECGEPVIVKPTIENLRDIVAAAEQSLKKGRHPVAYFATLVGRRDFDSIHEAAKARADKRVDSYMREKNGAAGKQ